MGGSVPVAIENDITVQEKVSALLASTATSIPGKEWVIRQRAGMLPDEIIISRDGVRHMAIREPMFRETPIDFLVQMINKTLDNLIV